MSFPFCKTKYRVESIANDPFFSLCGQSLQYDLKLTHTGLHKKNRFLVKLRLVEQFLTYRKKLTKMKLDNECIFCNRTFYKNSYFVYKDFVWKTDLIHYIEFHKCVPSTEFIQMIDRKYAKIVDRNYQKHSLVFIPMHPNKLSIIDAVMNHGGYSKRYIDPKNKYRYSEHYGVLQLNNLSIHRISIYSDDEHYVDANDPDIILPNPDIDLLKYDFIFHTHPPTPKPGGRAKTYGVIYEMPSINDLLYFIYNYNYGNVQGSLVMTPEGLYLIRKYILDNKALNINQSQMIDTIEKVMDSINERALLEYGREFTTYYFYSRIAQNLSYIEELNNHLKKFMIYIDYFPRTNKNGKWVVDTVYLPYFKKNQKKKF